MSSHMLETVYLSPVCFELCCPKWCLDSFPISMPQFTWRRLGMRLSGTHFMVPGVGGSSSPMAPMVSS